VSSIAVMPWSRATAQASLWNLFSWFGRACDQAAGVLLNPIIVAVFARSLESDPYRLSWLVVGYGLGWLLGSAIAPFLQRITARVMPWIVGGFIVRTAAIALMTFAVTDSASTANQRFQSILVCYVAYAIATGIARTAQARHVILGSHHSLWDTRSLRATIGTAAVTGIVAIAMWSAMSTRALSWNDAFGRIWILASAALGVATLAAIREGVELPEVPADPQPTARDGDRPPGASFIGVSAVVIAGLTALTFVEVIAFLLMFDEFRRQTVYLRGGLAFFAVGWVVGRLCWGAVRERLSRVVIAQSAVGCAAIGVIVATATPELSRAGWFPDTIRGHASVALLIYAVGFLIGAGVSVQRMALTELFAVRPDRDRWVALAVSAVACLAPLLVGWVGNQVANAWVLVGGIVLAMLVMAILGTYPGAPARQRLVQPAPSPSGPALLPRR
jgi:MFS family permease